jgi:hypothetical protein
MTANCGTTQKTLLSVPDTPTQSTRYIRDSGASVSGFSPEPARAPAAPAAGRQT